MCGIAGLFCSSASPYVHQHTVSMTSTLTHRGPDAEGVWNDGAIGMGHRRLSILDTTDMGAQPMQSYCGRFVMVFNGEIYNHLQLRDALENQGFNMSWRGRSDTETLLAGISVWGLRKTLTKCSGMFALALWDKKHRRLSLARDRVGEKPIYWGWLGNDLAFASELKALRAHPGFSKDVCKVALGQFLRYRYVPSPLSIYKNIYKLEAGTILDVQHPLPAFPKTALRPGENHGSLSISRFWHIDDEVKRGVNRKLNGDDEAISELRGALTGAVERQMLSDVPLGAFLSGGVDSSMIVAVMQSLSDVPVQTFTIGFDDPKFDESPHALAVAKHLGTSHNEIRITASEAREVIPNLPYIYDEPFADTSQVPTYLVCHAAKKNVTVALSGDGGDELFAGYDRYFWEQKIWKYFSPMPFAARRYIGSVIKASPTCFWDRLATISGLARPSGNLHSNLSDKALRLSEKLLSVQDEVDLYRSLVSEWSQLPLLSQDVSTDVDYVIERGSLFKGAEQIINEMMFLDFKSYLPDDILCKVDRASMGASLEVRTPFLDPEVIALAMRIPLAAKVRKSESKWVLRQLLYQYVPRNLIERPKSGFGIPIGSWLRGPLRDWAEDLLSFERLSKDGFFDPELIRKVWHEHRSGQRDWTSKLWVILMFQSWYESQK
ncbi:asparagine synthase (glutamine-hydrolyzing) [bacterium]|nr:asparagine synthase (glutamine-hydrolyzing) [bacterium]